MGNDRVIKLRENGVEILKEQGGSCLIPFPASARQLYATLALPPGSRCIRLLDLHAPNKSTLQPTAIPLTGNLRVARLDDFPSFAPLSYVWGSKALPSHTITCSPEAPYEVKLEITKNCYNALCSIRNQFRAVTIWVDSICINQEDEEEKLGQISLMHDIYSQAKSTYIWLGDGNEQSDRTIENLKNLSSLARRLPLRYLAAMDTKSEMKEKFLFEMRAWRDVGRKLTSLRQFCR
jgi:Heterokaryon incompatibility protein (HET)